MTTHYAYFEGVLDDVWQTKSVKTMCGKRTARKNTTVSGVVDCAACRAVLEEHITSSLRICAGVRDDEPGYRVGDWQKLCDICHADAVRIRAILDRG